MRRYCLIRLIKRCTKLRSRYNPRLNFPRRFWLLRLGISVIVNKCVAVIDLSVAFGTLAMLFLLPSLTNLVDK